MKCKTLDSVNPDTGEKTYKYKKSYNNQKEAQYLCKKVNSDPKSVFKMVEYKCKVCNNFHIGRSKQLITNKERNKYGKMTLKSKKKRIKNLESLYDYNRPSIPKPNIKIIGKIDLPE